MTEGEGTSVVELPESTHDAIQQRLPATEFQTVDEYVTYVVEEVLYEFDDDDHQGSQNDRQEVQNRLQDLGYLE